MTSENYISYLIGTANGYPSKTQRYLKTLFSAAGILLFAIYCVYTALACGFIPE